MTNDTNDGSILEMSIDCFLDLLPGWSIDLLVSQGYPCIVAEFIDGRYIQLLGEPVGIVTLEVMSNLYGCDWVLSAENEDTLRRLGFSEPAEGPYPNWTFRSTDTPSLETLLNHTNRVLRSIFNLQLSDTVKVRFDHLRVPAGARLVDHLVRLRSYYQTNSSPRAMAEFEESIEKLYLDIDEWREGGEM